MGLVTAILPMGTETLSRLCSRRSWLLALVFSWHKVSIPGLRGPTQLGEVEVATGAAFRRQLGQGTSKFPAQSLG